MTVDNFEPHPETRANFALMETQSGAMERYCRLEVETSDYQKRLKTTGISHYPRWMGVDEAAHIKRYLAKQIPPEHHDHILFSRLDDWAKEYQEIYQASPKWRLKNLISEISEAHAFLSWPNRWEQEIWKWAVSAENVRCPFKNRTEAFYAELRQQLRALIEEVDGFLYRCEETGQILFVPTNELAGIWRHQDHLAEIARNRPFGFFHDASRPNYRMRPPTDDEERMLSKTRRQLLLQRRWRSLLSSFSDRKGR